MRLRRDNTWDYSFMDGYMTWYGYIYDLNRTTNTQIRFYINNGYECFHNEKKFHI